MSTSLFDQDLIIRRKLRATRAALASVAFKSTNKKWADSSAEISKWLGEPWPLDIGDRFPLLYVSGDPPRIMSAGEDEIPGTSDDVQLFPVNPSAHKP